MNFRAVSARSTQAAILHLVKLGRMVSIRVEGRLSLPHLLHLGIVDQLPRVLRTHSFISIAIAYHQSTGLSPAPEAESVISR